MNRLTEFRNELIDKIVERVVKTKLETIEAVKISEGDSPIIISNVNDENSTFTLDRIRVELQPYAGGKGNYPFVYIDASSAYENTTVSLTEMGTDELAGLLEWLELYEDEIDELAESINPTAGEPKKVKRVIRFYRRAWTDVVVEVDEDADSEEIYEAANEKYNNGDYDDSAEDFENTDYADVTSYYKSNNLPPFEGWSKKKVSL